MPEAGCRPRFLRIQYHAGGRDATAFRGESGPETAFRGGLRGEFRFGGQDSCDRESPENATSHVEGYRRRVPPQSTTSNIAEYRQQVALKTNLQGTLKTRYFSVYLAYMRVSCSWEAL